MQGMTNNNKNERKEIISNKCMLYFINRARSQIDAIFSSLFSSSALTRAPDFIYSIPFFVLVQWHAERMSDYFSLSLLLYRKRVRASNKTLFNKLGNFQIVLMEYFIPIGSFDATQCGIFNVAK